MSKPRRLDWATNANHAAGGDPWSGQPNKVEPAAGKIATGRIPEERPPAEETNWWRNKAAAWLRWVSGVHSRNWTAADFTQVSAVPWPPLSAQLWHPGAVCYDAGNKCFTALNLEGNTITSYDSGDYFNPTVTAYTPGGQGIAWADESTKLLINPPNTPWGAVVGSALPGTYVDIASDGAGNRIAVCDDGAGVDLLARSLAYASWTIQTPASTGADWRAVDHDGSGLWAICDSTGQIDTSPAGAVWTARTSGLVGGVLPGCLRHTRDAANATWLALDSTNKTTSADGITWSAAAHGLPAQPLALAYDALYQRWACVASSGGVQYLYTSDNNGTSWTQRAALAFTGAAPFWWLSSDQQGVFVVLASEYAASGNNWNVWASLDGGVTSGRVDLPGGQGLDAAAGLAYGEVFAVVGSGTAWRSLRCDDA